MGSSHEVPTQSSTPNDITDVSLRLANASRFPLLRRLDQQWKLEKQFSDQGSEVSHIHGMNKVALASLSHQEQRLKDLQALLRSSSSIPTKSEAEENKDSRDSRQHTRRDISEVVTTHDSETSQSSDSAPILVEEATSATAKVDRTTQHVVTSVPDAPTNLTETGLRNDSFTITWDNHNDTIFDYEIKYTYSNEGKEVQVLQRCSRWCLKEPVPNGRYTVQNLTPETEYRDISIRSRNSMGWSEFSTPVKSLVTACKDEEYEKRRSKFLYRIGHLGGSIKSLEAVREQIPAQQVQLARNMSRLQRRTQDLDREIERVVAHDENSGQLLSSDLLQGSSQAFTKVVLKRKLEQERTICHRQIAQWRVGIMDLDSESSELSAEILDKTGQLSERRAALHQFDRQSDIVSSLRCVVSKKPADLKRHFLAKWRLRVSDQLELRQTLDSVAISCRRRIYAVAWAKLRSRETRNISSDEGVDGIGGRLLDVARYGVEQNLEGASNLIESVNELNLQQQENGSDNIDAAQVETTCPAHLLSREDKTCLQKGDFLFRTEHYESALKCYEQLLSKMECHEYLLSGGMSSSDALALYSDINGKIGHVHIQLRSFDLATVYFGRQLSLAEEEDLNGPKMRALLGLGICYHAKHEFVFAEQLLQRALDLCRSRGDVEQEIVAYEYLQKCCLCLNEPEEASAFAQKIQDLDKTSWERESGGNIVSRKGVETALQELDAMRKSLMDTVAKRSKVVKFEVASTHLVKLQRAKTEKEQVVEDSLDQLSALNDESGELEELIEQIRLEIHEAKHTKKNRLISALLQGSKQDIKASELLFRLQEELKIVESKHQQVLDEIPKTELSIHNARDDVKALSSEIMIEEGPLMKRVLQGREYRCVSLNASNTIRDDVLGKQANDGVPFIALTETSNCYIHSLETGKLDNVFIGSEEGSNATITSLFFYGNRVFTGTMNSLVVAYDISSSTKLFVAKGHEAAVTCIHADDLKVVSGSSDQSIIIWSPEGMLMGRLSGHLRGVHNIQCGLNYCVSSSYGTVFVWDIVTETNNIKDISCKQRLILPSDGNVTALHYGELEIIAGDNLGCISVMWIESAELLKSFKAHDASIASLQVDAVKAISCSLDRTIVISDVIRGERLQVLRGHGSPILALAFDQRQIISVSSDGELRQWTWDSPARQEKQKIKTKL